MRWLIPLLLCPACGFGLEPKLDPDGRGDDTQRAGDSQPGRESEAPDDSEPGADQPPVADAGADQGAVVDEVVRLDGSGSYDPEGAELGFAWELESLPSGSGVTLVNDSHVDPMFIPDRAGQYRVALVVDDGDQASDPDRVVVTVEEGGAGPVADAGADQAVAVGDTVRLDGSLSSDPDGDALSFAWTLSAAPSGSTARLSNPASAAPTFVADLAGRYEAQLVVSDGTSTSAPDGALVTASSDEGSDCGFGCARAAEIELRRRLGGQALLVLPAWLLWRRRRSSAPPA